MICRVNVVSPDSPVNPAKDCPGCGESSSADDLVIVEGHGKQTCLSELMSRVAVVPEAKLALDAVLVRNRAVLKKQLEDAIGSEIQDIIYTYFTQLIDLKPEIVQIPLRFDTKILGNLVANRENFEELINELVTENLPVILPANVDFMCRFYWGEERFLESIELEIEHIE